MKKNSSLDFDCGVISYIYDFGNGCDCERP